MKKIRIAQVITRLDRGGAPDIINIIFSRLGQDKFALKLISGRTTQPSSEIRQMLEADSADIVLINKLRRAVNPINDLIAFIRLYQLFKKEEFDIVHTHTAKAGVLGRLAAKFAGIPCIVHTAHGHNFYGYFSPLVSRMVVILERAMACLTDKIIVLTELEKRDFLEFKICAPEKISVVNSGLEIRNYSSLSVNVKEKKSQLGLGENIAVVGMIGRLEPVKGPQYFIESAKRVLEAYPNVKFLVAGDGSLRNKLETRCRQSGIWDKFIFTGWQEDITQILAILDILVLPSLNEAVGRILIEAGACGVAVVATKVGGVPEIVKDGQTGILVSPRDPEALADAVILLLKDEEKRKSMGRLARGWIDDKFSASRMIERISDVYAALADGKTD
jgi:glycosyltransferase involved in cell wall biosynthesis